MLENLNSNVGAWLSGGPDDDVVVSSRVRLARNVEGFPFLTRAGKQQVARLEEILRCKILSCDFGRPLSYWRLDQMDAVHRQLLVERHLIARDHAIADWVRGVAFDAGERLSLMVNEEDHLRIQVLGGGLRLEESWAEADRADDVLAAVVPYAFSARYGYLTACPTNVGTGMRASVMVHLPALVMAQEMEKAVELARGRRMAVRGLYGEGTHASADLYQLSNQATLGVSEREILEEVGDAVVAVMEMEREARNRFLQEQAANLTERVERALDLLRTARFISSEEALHLLSQVRLGVLLGLLKNVDPTVLRNLLLLTLPAHLQTMEGRDLDTLERDETRAGYLRERLGVR